jgi:hypothetical protein
MIAVFEYSRWRIRLQFTAELTKGKSSLEKYQDGSEAKLCVRRVLQADKPYENFQVVQLQESCSANKMRFSISLSPHKGFSTAHLTRPLFLIKYGDCNDSREST